MTKELKHRLIDDNQEDTSGHSRLTTGIQGVVATTYTLAFSRSFYALIKENPTLGVPLALCGVPGIFRIGWVLYGHHCAGLLHEQEEMSHLSDHLKDEQGNIEPPIRYWTKAEKLSVFALALLATFPLGLTKLNAEFDVGYLLAAFVVALIWFSIIDASPHVAHLQLQRQALTKFKQLPIQNKAWVVCLVLGHALSDSADLWNAPGWIRYWVGGVALPTELYLSNVEAVVHHKVTLPPLAELSAKQIFFLVLDAAGAGSIACLNWFNTYGHSASPDNNWWQAVFLGCQALSFFFTTYETWNHESFVHGHDHEHEHSGLICGPSSLYPKQENNGLAPQHKNSFV